MIATHDETRQTLLSLRKREGRGKEGRKEEARRGRGVKGCVNLVSSPIDPLEFRKFRSEGKLFVGVERYSGSRDKDGQGC